MQAQNITLLAQQEAARLCPEVNARQEFFRRAILDNLRTWEERRRETPAASEWDLLDALVARYEAEHHPSEPDYQERMEWARGVCWRLFQRDGLAFVEHHLRWSTLCRRFWPPGFPKPVISARPR